MDAKAPPTQDALTPKQRRKLLKAVTLEPERAARALALDMRGGSDPLNFEGVRAAFLTLARRDGSQSATDFAKFLLDLLGRRNQLSSFATALLMLEPDTCAPGTPQAAPSNGAGCRMTPETSDFFERARRWSCRIEIDGRVQGSGLVVGPSLVLTAWHVVRSKDPKSASGRIFVRLSDGRTVPALPKLVVDSPATALELKNTFAAADAADPDYHDHHDLALIRLAGFDGVRIGYPTLSSAGNANPAPANCLAVFDFPKGNSVGYANGRLISSPGLTKRLIHDAATSSGSSGGACFDFNRQFMGVHQGRSPKNRRLVPATTVLPVIRDVIARDVAPAYLWRLDEDLVIGRDAFFEAVKALIRENARPRGVRVKRLDAERQPTRGLSFSRRLLDQILERDGPRRHRVVELTFERFSVEVLDEIARRAGGPAAAAQPGLGTNETTRQATVKSRAETLASQLDDKASAAGQLWWFVFLQAPRRLASNETMELEEFCAAAIRRRSLRVVMLGFERLGTPGPELNGVEASDDGEPGFLVEIFGAVEASDIAHVVELAAADFGRRFTTHEADIRLDDILRQIPPDTAINGRYGLGAIKSLCRAIDSDLWRIGGLKRAPKTRRAGAPALARMINDALRFAALSGLFSPEDAFHCAHAPDPCALAVAASTLANCCETGRGDGRWLMRAGHRQRLLLELAENGSLAAAIVERRKRAPDDDAKDILDALAGKGVFAKGAATPQEAAAAERFVTTLERLGPRLCARHGATKRLDKAMFACGRAADGARPPDPSIRFVGRHKEERKLARLLSKAKCRRPPVGAVLISGSGGIGKSTLLERAVEQWRKSAPPRARVVRLDFDRPSLDALDPVGLTLEAARQLGVVDPAHAGAVTKTSDAATTLRRDQPTRGEQPDRLAPKRLMALKALIPPAASGSRPTLVVMDTCEALRARGATHPERVFVWLDSLFKLGVGPLTVIAAGRGDAFGGLSGRAIRRLAKLQPLSDKDASQIVAGSSSDVSEDPALQALHGYPLLLELASKSLDGGALVEALIERILLSRLPNPSLKRFARCGLVVRWLTPSLAADLAVACGLNLQSPRGAEAERLVGELSRQQWLCETFDPRLARNRDGDDPNEDKTDVAPGEGAAWIRIRPEIRRQILPLLRSAAPDQCRQVDECAARWFERRPDPLCRTEALYHRLQLMRSGGEAPTIDRSIARNFGLRTLDELPPGAQAVLSAAQHDVGGPVSDQQIVDMKWRAAAAHTVDHSGALDLRAYMEKSDWVEAGRIFKREFEGRLLARASDAADAARTFLWRAGRWSEARGLLGAGLACERPGALRQLDRTAWLEMRAEFDFARFVDELRAAARRRPEQGACDLAAALTRNPLYGAAFDLGAGALGFCLETARVERPPAARRLADPVGAAFDLWGAPQDEERRSWRLSQAVLIANRQRQEHGHAPLPTSSEGERSASACARALASLTPYAAPFVMRLRLSGADFDTRPDLDNIEILRDLGAFAEWSALAEWGAAAQPRPADPRLAADLSLIAQAAGRFRETVFGRWAYPAPPPERWPKPSRAHEADLSRDGGTLKFMRAADRAVIRASKETIKATGPRSLFLTSLRKEKSMDEFVDRPPGVGRRSHEESMAALETLIPRFRQAAAKMIETQPDWAARFGMTDSQALDALSAGPARLETLGVNPPALEALIRMAGRPPLIVRDNKVELQPLFDFPADTDVKIRRVEPLVASVGRVEFVNHDMIWGGTAWVLDKTAEACTVVTNRHVAELVARRAANGAGVFMRSPVTGLKFGAAVDFNEEIDARREDARAAPVLAVTYLAENHAADAALMKVSLPSGVAWTLPAPIELAERDGELNELVAVIGYPARDSRNEKDSEAIAALARYFNDGYDLKRFSPGMLIRSTSTDGLIRYDCTTLGGNSGSPVVSLDQRAVIGLHFAGAYGVENTAVSLTTLRALRDRGGRGLSPGALLHDQAAQEARADGVHSAEDLANRAGYESNFLGDRFVAPWPGLSADVEATLARPADATEDRPHELRYTHFGVKFSTVFKLPAITAVNIDGELSVPIKRGADQWFFDARIPLETQHGAAAYADPSIDRGHMVRREDPNWGADARQANADTFHYVNSAPQHSDLNQGKTLWQGLENYILGSARTYGFRACVFTGPVFGEDDPEIDGLRVPLEFWKLVAMIGADRESLHATAYLLSQGQLIRKLIEKRNRPEAREGARLLGAYRTFQIRIADLAEATGYDFAAFIGADPLGRLDALKEAVTANQPVVFELNEMADAVL
ncbi:DNA/RNA non-specific endonuclease [Methylocella sp.]|uniref:DNA/RNA non-specific endonuclease n=1 Tax=Methylocella sp. TaxID=1978226 RepID=UPI0037841FDD